MFVNVNDWVVVGLAIIGMFAFFGMGWFYGMRWERLRMRRRPRPSDAVWVKGQRPRLPRQGRTTLSNAQQNPTGTSARVSRARFVRKRRKF
jgi:hypothetical protein